MPPKKKVINAATQTDETPLPYQLILIQPPQSYEDDDYTPQNKRKRLTDNYSDLEREYLLGISRTERKRLLESEKALQAEINKGNSVIPLRFKVLSSSMSPYSKSSIIRKLDMLNMMDPSHGEYHKMNQYIQAVCKIPLGNFTHPYDGTKDIKTYLSKVKTNLDEAVFGHVECKDHILRLLAQWVSNPNSPGLVIGISGPMGCGKCHGRNTPILMFNGDVKLVQDVQVGELLMGDDNTPRRVESLANGRDCLYEITYINQGHEKYTVNESHILCLWSIAEDKVIEISVKDYLALPAEKQMNFTGLRATHEVVFEDETTPIDLQYIMKCIKNGNRLPRSCLTSSVQHRKEILFKIINEYGTSIPSTKSTIDIAFIARSRGITWFGYNETLEITTIPHASICDIEVSLLGYDEYFGFVLDGNSRYLLGDFTVTHNTTLVKHGICKSLGLPFGFVPLGGISDGSFLLGHSYTYEGSRWGRIVDILMACGTMNPILFFDELDKISNTFHGEEIKNILIHLTDATQNNDFHDKYFSDVTLDMSKALMIFSFNDESLVDPILKDRMVIIRTNGYSRKDKHAIIKKHMLQEVCSKYGLSAQDIVITDSVVDAIISRTDEEKGVRNLKRSLESILSRLNLRKLTEEGFTLPYTITKDDVISYVEMKVQEDSRGPCMMYI